MINTEQSIHINSDSKSIDLTYSPWIYQELVCSKIIRKKPLALYRYNTELYHSISESYRYSNTNEALTISYNAPTQHLIKINQDILQKWKRQFDGEYPFPLDLLYNEYFRDVVEETRSYIKY